MANESQQTDSILESEHLTLDVARKLIQSQQQQIQSQQQQIQELKELVEKLQGKNPTSRLKESWSLSAEAKRKQRQQRDADRKRKKKKRKDKKNARMKTADKVKLAERTETVYPAARQPKDCHFSHDRVAWRLENGKAILVHYQIFRYQNEYGKPEGLIGRGEFAVEIMIALAYQVYIVGLSIDKACQLLNFFEQLKLRKSQADALLNQLARAWEGEFETLCTLLANAAVVHSDETSWSINSVWAFLSEHLTVMFYGVHKDGSTLATILDKSQFQGTLVSDNAAVYQGFTKSQKCWAHLIRKAIKLTLEDPSNEAYRSLADELLSIYRDAKKLSLDRRFGEKGRKAKVAELDDRVLEACSVGWTGEPVGIEGPAGDYHRLCNELMGLMVDRELFLFVMDLNVTGTNNASERQLRSSAMARRTGRTSKTPRGSKRQSILESVIESIGKQLKDFNLASVIDEVKRWTAVGQSCFEEKLNSLEKLQRKSSKKGILDKLILNADK